MSVPWALSWSPVGLRMLAVDQVCLWMYVPHGRSGVDVQAVRAAGESPTRYQGHVCHDPAPGLLLLLPQLIVGSWMVKPGRGRFVGGARGLHIRSCKAAEMREFLMVTQGGRVTVTQPEDVLPHNSLGVMG